MDKNIKFLTVAIVAIIAIAGSYFFPQVQTQVRDVIGAVSTLDGVDNPSVSVAGKKEYWAEIPLNATSSMVLSLVNPLQATSTATYLSCESTNVGIAAANNLFFGTTTTASRYATTTANSWAQGFAMGTGQWSYRFLGNTSTSSDPVTGVTVNVLEGRNPDGSSNYILGPTEVLYGIIATSTAGTFATYDAGSCKVRIEKI